MSRDRVNPFYPLVLVAGIAFTLTVCAYTWMSYLAARPPSPAVTAAASGAGFEWLRSHGSTLVFGELSVLVAASLAAMALDSRNRKRARPR